MSCQENVKPKEVNRVISYNKCVNPSEVAQNINGWCKT